MSEITDGPYLIIIIDRVGKPRAYKGDKHGDDEISMKEAIKIVDDNKLTPEKTESWKLEISFFFKLES